MILDGRYINEDQITCITFRKHFTKSPIYPLYKVSKFKYFKEWQNQYEVLLIQDSKMTTINTPSRGSSEYTEIMEKIQKENLQNMTENDYGYSGWVDATIELSSGTTYTHKIHDFEKHKFYDARIEKWSEKHDGEEFNPDDIDIDYVCSRIFSPQKEFKKNKKIMINSI